jgi:hypothetical protein
MERLAKARCEQQDLMFLRDTRITRGECHELLALDIHQALAVKKSQVT